MLNVIIGALIALAVAGMGGMASLISWQLAFSFFLALFSVGAFGLIGIGYWYFLYSNRIWRFSTSEIKDLPYSYFDFRKKEPSWKVTRQKKGMFYEIDFGREQNVIEFNFSCGYSTEAPLKSRIWFRRSTQSRKLTIFPDNGAHPYVTVDTTYKRLKEAIPTQYIRMEILEPDLVLVAGIPKPWRVEAVYIRIKTFFGEYTIGNHWWDKLDNE